MKPQGIEIGVILITTEDIILAGGNIYIPKDTHCEVLGIHESAGNMHVRVSNNDVLVLYYNSDPYITIEEFNRRKRIYSIDTLIGKNEEHN